MFHVSSLIFHGANGGARRIFLTLPPTPPSPLFLIPAVRQPAIFHGCYAAARHFNFCHGCCPRTFRPASRPEQLGRACDLQLNIYGRVHRELRSLSAESNQEWTLSPRIISGRITFSSNHHVFFLYRITYTESNGFAEVSENLARYRSEDNLVRSSKVTA